MNAKNVWRVFVILTLIAGLAVANSVYALGTPQIVSVSPGSGSPVGTTVTVHATVTWDSDFRSMRICFGGENYCQEDATPDITKSFNTSNLGAGMYQIIAEVAAVNQGWDTANKTYANYQLTANQPAPQPQPSVSCSVGSFDVSPRSVTQGDSLHFEGFASCSGANVRATRVILDGGSDIYEIGNPSISHDWSSSGLSAGQHKFIMQVAAIGDNNWTNIGKSSPIYVQVSAPGQPAPAPSCPFNKSDVVETNDGKVWIMDGGCNRHWVPNPPTLDALGIPRSWINNKGLSNSDLLALHRGADAPSVSDDPSGFQAFKDKYFPNTEPITPGGSNNQNQPVQNQDQVQLPPGIKGTIGDCPASPALLKPKDIAVVGNTDLNLRPSPGIDNDPIMVIPNFSYVTIIAGPKCDGGTRWYEVGFKGNDGWAAEVGEGGIYHMIPNGYKPGSSGPNTSAGNPALGNNNAPATQVPSSSENGNVNPCPESAINNWVWLDRITGVSTAYAESLSLQCVNYVRNHRPDTDAIHGSGGDWANIAESLGFSVDHGDLSKGQTGDVVVWSGSCALSQYGHVAILLYTITRSDGSIEMHVNEANHITAQYPDGDGRVYDNQVYNFKSKNKSCMSFIHAKPGTNVNLDDQNIPSNSDQSRRSGNQNQSQQQSQQNKQNTDVCSQYSGLRWFLCKIFGR